MMTAACLQSQLDALSFLPASSCSCFFFTKSTSVYLNPPLLSDVRRLLSNRHARAIEQYMDALRIERKVGTRCASREKLKSGTKDAPLNFAWIDNT
jgi:hypothetical protein